MMTIFEPARETSVVHETDVCVLGGSCTGLFAAIRAARLGARVAIVERQNCFGGVATSSMVNVWHSPYDTEFKQQIIGGLTLELIERLRKRNAVTDREKSPDYAWAFNSEEMKIELDEMAAEAKLKVFLHTSFTEPHVIDGRLDAVIVENKSGRGAIRAKYFVDATGDADLCTRMGMECYYSSKLQPSTACCRLGRWDDVAKKGVYDLLHKHGAEVDLPPGFAWGAWVPDSPSFLLAGTRVAGVNPTDADGLTFSEMEGRRQVRAILDLVRKYYPESRVVLEGLPSRIGLRESRHVRSFHQLTGEEILSGKRFDDAIANSSYRVDIHHHDKPGITLKYLDGTQLYAVPGQPGVHSRWRPETTVNPSFYQIPYRSIVPKTSKNVLVAGRMIDADVEAHAAIRVMVNMNQTGEAAGVASVLGLESGKDVSAIDPAALRKRLAAGGSVML